MERHPEEPAVEAPAARVRMDAQDADEPVGARAGAGDRHRHRETHERPDQGQHSQPGHCDEERARRVEPRLVHEALGAAQDGAEVVGERVQLRGDRQHDDRRPRLPLRREERDPGDDHGVRQRRQPPEHEPRAHDGLAVRPGPRERPRGPDAEAEVGGERQDGGDRRREHEPAEGRLSEHRSSHDRHREPTPALEAERHRLQRQIAEHQEAPATVRHRAQPRSD